MVLHLINKHSVITPCVNNLADGDAILCIEHACDLETIKSLQAQLDASMNIQVYVLTDNTAVKKLNNITLITNDDFVTLTSSAEKVVSWY